MTLSPETLARFQELQLTPEEVAEIALSRPSLRGMLMGYAAEYKAQKEWFSGPLIQDLTVPDDHDRKQKFDMRFVYKGLPIRVEVKSVKGDTVRIVPGGYIGRVQCRGSDKRKIQLAGGVEFETTNLRVGDFDLLVANLFHFGKKWHFAFALNNQLPTTAWGRYEAQLRGQLLPNFIPITWPLVHPFYASPFDLLDALVRERMRGVSIGRLDED